MKNGEHKIVLIEPSDIISLGIKELFRINRLNIDRHYKSFTEFKDDFLGNCDVLIVDSICLRIDEHSHIKQLITDKNVTRVLILDRGGNDSRAFYSYDGALLLGDSNEIFLKKILSVINNKEDESSAEHSELTERERDILTEIAKGKTNKEIATQFNISVHTVMTHRKNISKKTGITSGAGLAVYGIINKLVDMRDLG